MGKNPKKNAKPSVSVNDITIEDERVLSDRPPTARPLSERAPSERAPPSERVSSEGRRSQGPEVPMDVDHEERKENHFTGEFEVDDEEVDVTDDEEMIEMRKQLKKMEIKNRLRAKLQAFQRRRSPSRSRASSPRPASASVFRSRSPQTYADANPPRRRHDDGASVQSATASIRSSESIRSQLEKKVKQLSKEKEKHRVCCECKSAAACSGNLCGCKNTREQGCGKHCGCQTKSPYGCFNPLTKKELRQKYKHVRGAPYLLKDYKHSEKRGPDDETESDTESSGSSDSD